MIGFKRLSQKISWVTLVLFLAVTVLAGMPAQSAYAAEVGGVTISTETEVDSLNIGDEFTVEISMQNAKLKGLDFGVNWDNNTLEYVKRSSQLPELDDKWISVSTGTDTANGLVCYAASYTVTGEEADLGTDCKIYTITLKVKAEGASFIKLFAPSTHANPENGTSVGFVYSDLTKKYAVPASNITNDLEDFYIGTPPSDDTSVASVVVAGVTAAVDEDDPTVYNVELPAGTVLADLNATDVLVTPVAGAVVGTPATSDGGATWTVEVTAEDGVTTETYTINVVVLPLDTTPLEDAIAAAQDALDGVEESGDGSDLPAGTEWATPDAIDDLEDAIGDAQDALDEAETQQEIDDAAAALNAAIGAFNTAKRTTELPGNAIQGITPVRNAVAKTSVETAQYIANVEWSPALASGGKFADSTAYTATITVVPKAGYTLNGVPENYFSVQGAVSATNDTGSGVVTAIFPKTTSASTGGGGGGGGGAVAPTVTGIEIKAAPDKVSYDEGDKLDLAGLAVTVTYSDGTTKDIAAKDFAKNDITVSPKDGDVLDADVKAIEIKANGKTAKQVIVVEKKDIVTPPDIDETVDKPVLTDIDGHWAQNYIDYLVGIGAISGYPDGTFRPDAPITRAEFAKVIVDAFELKGTGKVFEDTADHWAKNYVAIAAANGIVLGYNENEFGPDDLITREQMAIIIVKAAGLAEETGVLDFIDEGNVSSWAYNWVVSAVENNLMSGYEDNSFKPLNNATRAEAVTVIYNVLMK